MNRNSDGELQTTIDFLRTIMVHELELEDDRVLIYDERTKLPKDEGLFIVLASAGAPRVLANRNIPDVSGTGITERQEVNLQESIVISAMSRNTDAINRAWEMAAALKSIFAQQVQERQSFKIFPNGNMTDVSTLEGAAMLKRFDLNVVALSWYAKSKAVDYYETFSAELNTEKEQEINIPVQITGD